MNAYYEAGYRAFDEGKAPADNPYAGQPFAEAEWRRGWRAAEQESTNEEEILP